jgi:hypothetical protein
LCGPCDVFLVWESVQWPVIAINDMRFVSLQQLAVNDIFPSALYIINKRMKQYKWEQWTFILFSSFCIWEYQVFIICLQIFIWCGISLLQNSGWSIRKIDWRCVFSMTFRDCWHVNKKNKIE